MKKYMYDYIKQVDDILNKNDSNIDYNDLIEKHLIKIEFFTKERIIHLLVTLFYGIFDLLFFYFSMLNPLCLIILVILTIVLVFYVVHYFRLENGVQYMYKQYDKMQEQINKYIKGEKY